ncbi:MAG: T9SS type A sorting domain-containing protein, partial [candidate division WOR-3 bacterium]|nr:T9SS type A sorting domain-containing protein [candidate division WOR-3 bacterium]
MISISLLALTLWGGVLVEPFRIADAEQGHHQGCLRTATASDGHFAVAWLDSLQLDRWRCELELYIRFFDQNGSPLTDAYKITKAADTNQIGGSHLDMDSAGNTVLLWTEVFGEDLLRLQLFDTSGNPLGSPQTDHQGYVSWKNRSVAVSLNDQGEFAIAWDVGRIFARRYSFEGGPQGDPFMVHDDPPDRVSCNYPGVVLNDAGDLVVTWHEFRLPPNATSYPRFQVFDAEDEPILGWEPRGHLVNEDSSGGHRVESYWLDNDRFVMFWKDPSAYPIIVGRVFSDRGLTRHPIRWLIWEDTLWCAHGGPEGWYSTAVSPNDSFAYTHIRTHYDYPDTKLRTWEHDGGILGYIQDNEPIRWTNLFEYTPPLGADTINSIINNYPRTQPPAVACSDDRLVWVYSRLNTDTIFEAFAMITDWDMGIGVVERPIFTQSPIRLSASLNRLFYDVSGSVTGEAKLTLYSADGRRILKETIQGKGIWEAPKLPSGVYF